MKTSKLAEQQIRKAQTEGQLDNLKGAGKPLKRESGDTADAAGYRIMAEAVIGLEVGANAEVGLPAESAPVAIMTFSGLGLEEFKQI